MLSRNWQIPSLIVSLVVSWQLNAHERIFQLKEA